MLRFLSSCSGHHLDLHSFPTRRSSDLARSARERRTGRCILDHRAERSCGSARAPVGVEIERSDSASARSEEHTSELQSLRHLVCRLLLEKKKSTNITEHCMIGTPQDEH